MQIDLALLDRRFELIRPENAGSQIASVFEKQPGTQFFVVGTYWAPGASALLLERSALITAIAGAAFRGRSEDTVRHWEDALERTPRILGTIIAGIILKEFPVDESGARVLRLTDRQAARAHSYLQKLVGTVPNALVIDASNALPESLGSYAIVARKGKVLGIYDARSHGTPITESGWGRPRSNPDSRWFRGHEHASHMTRPVFPSPAESPSRVMRGALAEDEEKPKPKRTARRKKGAPTPASASAFAAFPRLSVLSPARREEPLAFAVGYSAEPDPTAIKQTALRIDNPRKNDEMLIIASAEGASIDEPSFVALPLRMAAEHTFTARIASNANKVTLRAQYLYRGKLAGTIVKGVAVETSGGAMGLPSYPADDAVGMALGRLRLNECAAVDLILFVEKSTPGNATWRAVVPRTNRVSEAFVTQLEDEARFAKEIASYGDSGWSALEELRVTGTQIAEKIP